MDVLSRIPVGQNNKVQPHEICKMIFGKGHTKNELQNVQREVRRRASVTSGIGSDPDINSPEEDDQGNEIPYKGKRFYWWKNQESKTLWASSQAKNIHIGQTVAFSVLNKHLRVLLPSDILTYVSPLISAANDSLNKAYSKETQRFSQIEEKTEVVYQALPMHAEDIDPVVRDNIFTAVLESKPIEVDYKSGYDPINWSGRLTLSLQKLIFKYSHLKVIALNHANNQVRELTVSRFANIKLLNKSDFISASIEPINTGITLRTNSKYFYEQYFQSVSISDDQTIEHDAEQDQWLIKFTLPLMPEADGIGPNYFDLINQLSGWADQLEVVSPPELRVAMEERINNMVKRYALNEC